MSTDTTLPDDGVDYDDLGKLAYFLFHGITPTGHEPDLEDVILATAALIAVYQEQRRTAGFVELTPAEWADVGRVLDMLCPIVDRIAAKHDDAAS